MGVKIKRNILARTKNIHICIHLGKEKRRDK